MKKHLTLVSLLMLTGCSLAPAYERPTVKSPAAWSAATSGSAVSATWWTTFGSAELDQLMTQALAENLELKASVARIDQARAGVKSARSGLFPSASATAGTSHDDGDDSWRAGAGISYELDLFGAVRSGVDASRAQLAGSEFSHEALKLVVMGDVAQTYFNLLNARERLQIAGQNLSNAQDTLNIIQARFDAGADSALEVSQQTSTVESAKTSQATQEQNVKTYENAFSVLLGKPPSTVAVATTTLSDLKVPAIDAGVPSSLLERRPDIRKAEADLVAANADIGAARAALYPSVTLGLDWTVAASSWGNPATTALALASSLAAPIFQGGRLEAGVEQATARQTELIETYRQVVLVAFREVEDALAAVKAAQSRETSLYNVLQSAQEAYDLSQSRYRAGTIDFQTLLNTQNSLYSARDSFLQARNDRLQASVTLYKALGGGWQ